MRWVAASSTIPVVKHDGGTPKLGRNLMMDAVAVTIDRATRDAAVCVQLFPMHYRSPAGQQCSDSANWKPSDNARTYRATFLLLCRYGMDYRSRVWQRRIAQQAVRGESTEMAAD